MNYSAPNAVFTMRRSLTWLNYAMLQMLCSERGDPNLAELFCPKCCGHNEEIFNLAELRYAPNAVFTKRRSLP